MVALNPEPQPDPIRVSELHQILFREFTGAARTEGFNREERIIAARIAATVIPRLEKMLSGENQAPEFLVGEDRGHVAMQFNIPLTAIRMTPDEARELALLLVQKADGIANYGKD